MTVAAGAKSRGTKLLILLLVASQRNQREFARVPVRWLVELSGMTVQTVRESLEALCDIGDLSRAETGGGKGKPTTFRVVASGEALDCQRVPEDYYPPQPWTRSA